MLNLTIPPQDLPLAAARFSLASPPAGEATLRERVIDFYHQHYDANVMNLAVVAPQSLDTLEEWVVEHFADIPDNGLSVPDD